MECSRVFKRTLIEGSVIQMIREETIVFSGESLDALDGETAERVTRKVEETSTVFP